MDPLTLATLIGGGVGLAKTGLDQSEINRQRQYQATVARFSPWTHQAANPVGNANPIGGLLQGGLAGAAIGQQIPGSSPYGSMEGAQAYSGVPAANQPASPALTPSGYDPSSGESYADFLSRQALGGAGPLHTTSPYAGIGGR